jgi:site-specific DNA recombinase
MEQTFIKDVAIYLRKSRGDEETALEKHREMLLEMVVKNDWRYVIYEEIASSESIDDRPKFSLLFNEIKEGLYDAVLVADYDRLGRGEEEDQGRIRNAFKSSSTYVVTPEKIYDLNNESDEDHYKFKGFFANLEYTSIKRRLKRGKIRGSKRGDWTNGKPPFPYIYVPAKKGIIVDEEKRELYNEMKKMFFEGLPFKKISWYLNNKGILSPNNKVWHENAVRRVLIDETHIGRIISNKTKGSGHKNKKTATLVYNPRSEWVIVENCHEALKTQEEHDQMLVMLKARKTIPDTITKGVYLLSGLVFCEKCKKAILMQTKDNGTVVTKGCQYSSPFGVKCFNKGVNLDILTEALMGKLEEYETRLMQVNETDNKSEERLHKLMDMQKTQLNKTNESIRRIREMYEDGEYSKEVYTERVSNRKVELSKIEKEIDDLQKEITIVSKITNTEKFNKITLFRESLENKVEVRNLNIALRKIVSRIEYRRETLDSIDIDVIFQ